MTETAASQLRRILHVIPRLADGEEHAIAEVARLAEVDPRVLMTDLESIAERYDAPGGFVEGVQIFVDGRTVSVLSNHFLRPMRLTMAELGALELGLSVLRAERSPDETAPIERALLRLREVITRLPSNERHEGLRHAELSASGDVRHLATVRKALRARRKVRLRYRAGGATDASERVICPYGTAFSSGMWYVVAHCERSEGMRFFRLDRVEDAQPIEASFEEPDLAAVDAMLREKPFHADRPTVMTVRYSPRIARWVAEREGRPLSPDGSLTMDHPVADIAWGVRHVLQYGPDAEVIAPAEMRAAVRERLTGLAAALES